MECIAKKKLRKMLDQDSVPQWKIVGLRKCRVRKLQFRSPFFQVEGVTLLNVHWLDHEGFSY